MRKAADDFMPISNKFIVACHATREVRMVFLLFFISK